MIPPAQEPHDRSALARLEQRLMAAVTARGTGPRPVEGSTEEPAEA